MALEIGVDIEEITRFKKMHLNSRFLNIIFTKKEQELCKKKKEPYISFAGKFCAKEAVIKSWKGKINIKDIEVINSSQGKIEIWIKGKHNPKIKCSVSHTKKYAVAFVIIEK